jgi:ABC-type Mn2+/Zn2+ transport system ATPase subunit
VIPPPVLEADAVSYAYPGSDEPAVRAVDLGVAAGEFVALVGPNGSGKSTLLRLVLGLLAPTTGTVALLGHPPAELRDRWRVGYVPQRRILDLDIPATVAEVVGSGRTARRGWWRRPGRADREALDHALEAVALTDLRAHPVGHLSGGQRQRVLIARALAAEPSVLVLDEPIAGVDQEAQGLFRDSLVHLVEHHAAAVLLVSHELGAVAADLDRVVVLKQRVLFDGPPDDLASTGVHLGVHADDLPRWLEELEP